MTGRVYGVAGPSGAGKDTLMAAVRTALPAVHLARRAITRPAGLSGEDFESLDGGTFAARRAAGGFVLDWAAHGLRYGIPHAEIAPAFNGATVLVNLSRRVLCAAAECLPNFAVFLIHASPATLQQRLVARGREAGAAIDGRLRRAETPLPATMKVHVIDNDTALSLAVTAVCRVLQADRA